MTFHEISSQVGSKLSEVRPYHKAWIGRRPRPRYTQLSDPGLGGLTVVLLCRRAKASRFDRLARPDRR
jgi:hypothetical protein